MLRRSVPLWISKSSLGKLYNSALRKARSSKSKYGGKKLRGKPFSNRKPVRVDLSFLKSQLFAIVCLIAFLSILSFHLYKYFTISVPPFFPDKELRTPNLIGGDEINIGIYIISEESEGGIRYVYVEEAHAVLLNSSSKRMISIHPRFVVQPDPTFSVSNIYSFINNYSDSELDQFQMLNRAISFTFGLRIDRYVVMKKDTYYSMFNNLGFSGESPASDEAIQLEDSATLLEGFLDRIVGFTTVYEFLLNQTKLANLIKSDMSRNDLLLLLSRLGLSRDYQKLSIGLDSAQVIEDADKEGNYRLNSIVVDEKLRSFLQNIEILSEQAEIEIFNATSISGYASQKRREFLNNGANIVKYGNYFKTEQRSKLFVDEQDDINRFRGTINMIRRSLGDKLEIIVDDFELNKTGNIVLVLGEEQ